MEENERKELIENHFLFKEGDRFLDAAGLNRDWPEGRGIFINGDYSLLVWINEEDELRIISMLLGDHIDLVFKRLSRFTELIESALHFAHDDKLGYLTSCPTNIGTGLRASVHIQLPYMAEHEDELYALAQMYNL